MWLEHLVWWACLPLCSCRCHSASPGHEGTTHAVGMLSQPYLWRKTWLCPLLACLPAAINSGNSGGPVIAADGRCIGIAFQSLTGDTQSVG